MSEPFIGEIKMFGGNFAPRGYALCDGQLLPISQNTALFSILGTTYGGDGRTTFKLPDLRSRVPMHEGRGSGLSQRSLGQSGGNEQVTLNSTQIPSHSHTQVGTTNTGNTKSPAGATPAISNDGESNYHNQTTNLTSMGTNTQPTGGGQPHDNMPPYQVINFIIALTGIFPSRS